MFEILQEFDKTAYTALLYGEAGIGKTSFATWSQRPLVFNLENGMKGIDLKTRKAFATSVITDWNEFLKGLNQFGAQKKFDTAVIDTVSRLEDMMIAAVCFEGKKASLADFAYGAGYGKFTALTSVLTETMDSLKLSGKNVILIAHEKIETFQDPESESYDRFTCSLDKRIAEKIKANVDYIFHMKQEKTIKEQGTRNQAKHRNRILIQTKSSGGIVAKSRGEMEQFLEVKNDSSASDIWNIC